MSGFRVRLESTGRTRHLASSGITVPEASITDVEIFTYFELLNLSIVYLFRLVLVPWSVGPDG